MLSFKMLRAQYTQLDFHLVVVIILFVTYSWKKWTEKKQMKKSRCDLSSHFDFCFEQKTKNSFLLTLTESVLKWDCALCVVLVIVTATVLNCIFSSIAVISFSWDSIDLRIIEMIRSKETLRVCRNMPHLKLNWTFKRKWETKKNI